MDQFSFVSWLGHSSFKFKNSKTGTVFYYVDPYRLPEVKLESADAIFITHAHQDHFSPQDIERLSTPQTTIIGPSDCTSKEFKQKKLDVVPNEVYETHGIKFETFPAYNNNPTKLSYHPKENNWVGYIFDIAGLKIYHAGDTDFIPEMKGLSSYNLDLALLPIGGTYTMGVEEAADAANAISAKYTAPIHYKGLLGEKVAEEENKFKSLVVGSKVIFFEEIK